MAKVTLAQRTARKINLFFLTTAFVMYLLCSISVPVTGLAFLNYQMSGTKALTVGMWGYCSYDISSTGAYSNKNCTKPTVPFLINLNNLPGRKNAGFPDGVGGKLSIPLVLFPIATGLAFLAMLTSHREGHLSLLNSQGAAGLGGAVIVIMFLFFERSDEQIRQTIGNVTGGLGVCLWLGLTGALCASIGLIAAIMSGASETRLHGSLIKKEAYQMESETY